MKKILMVNPPTGIFIRDDRCQSNVEEFLVSVTRPPHELLIMAAILENDGCKVVINDYPSEKKAMIDFKQDVIKLAPDILVVNATIPTLIDDLACVRIAKQINQNTLSVLRCGAIEQIAESVMNLEPMLDFILYGETDFTLSEFLKSKNKETVKGVFYRYEGKIIETQKRPFLKDLDSLPIVDRNMIKSNLYTRPDTEEAVGLIEVSRGCPYKCIFCLVPVAYGSVHRTRSVENVMLEIRICVKKYGITNFHFKSDLFSFKREWVLELCKEIIKNKLNIKWFANSRADTIDQELIFLMKNSGCFALAIGVESGSQKILDKIGKKTNLNQIKNTFNLCRREKIKTYAYFIIGFPWDTENTIRETIDFSKKIDPDYIDFFFPYAFPGTKFYETARELGLIDVFSLDNIIKNSYINSQSPTLAISKSRLIQLRKKALKEFYFRPGYILRTFKNCKNFNEVLRLLKYGMASLKKITG